LIEKPSTDSPLEVSFLRILLSQASDIDDATKSTHYEAVVEHITESEGPVSDAHVLMLCYSVVKLRPSKSFDSHSGLEQFLRRNYATVKKHFDEAKYPFLHPKDEKGKPPPPRARTAAPPRNHVQLQHQVKEPCRALPGYTTGEMAAEYARKHNL
jgi:hypothetical protein